VVEGAGGELRSTQILPAEELEADLGFRRTALRVHFVVTIDGLEETLYELETGQPYLIIDEVTVRQERARRRRSEPQAQPMLDVSLELFGYVREEPA
jgi:hypothetical protein